MNNLKLKEDKAKVARKNIIAIGGCLGIIKRISEMGIKNDVVRKIVNECDAICIKIVDDIMKGNDIDVEALVYNMSILRNTIIELQEKSIVTDKRDRDMLVDIAKTNMKDFIDILIAG